MKMTLTKEEILELTYPELRENFKLHIQSIGFRKLIEKYSPSISEINFNEEDFFTYMYYLSSFNNDIFILKRTVFRNDLDECDIHIETFFKGFEKYVLNWIKNPKESSIRLQLIQEHPDKIVGTF